MRTLKKLLLAVVSVFVVVLLPLELASRLYQANRGQTIEDSLFSPCYRHYFLLGPAFKPGSRCSWQGIPEMRINSLGFRGEEFPIEKTPGTFRIVTLGASTSHSGNYPAKLEELLKQKSPQVEVINAAVPAWNTTQSLIQFISRVVYLKPDLVLVYHAINDIGLSDEHWLRKLPEVDYGTYSGFLVRNSQLFVFLRNRLEKLRPSYAAASATVSKESSGEAVSGTKVFENDMTHLIVLAKHHGIRVGLITMALNHDPAENQESNAKRAGMAYQNFPFAVSRVAEFNRILRNLARNHHVQLIDAADSGMGFDPGNFVDLCHFSEEGASKFAQLIHREIATTVRDLR